MFTEVDVGTKEYFGNWLKAIHGELQLIRKILYDMEKKEDAKGK